MSVFAELLKGYSEADLKTLAYEIFSYEQTGTLSGEAMLREVRSDFVAANSITPSFDTGCKYTAEQVLMEIARRWVKTV